MTIQQAKTIKVCQGAGCKAWGAKDVLRRLKSQFRQEVRCGGKRVRTTSCMNRCGGGASVEIEDASHLFKIRDLAQLTQSMLCTTPASL